MSPCETRPCSPQETCGRVQLRSVRKLPKELCIGSCTLGFASTVLPAYTTPNMRPALVFSTIILLMVSIIGGAHLRSQQMLRREVEQAARYEDFLPKRILWIWERPEDLRELDPSSTGVAVLEATLHLGSSATRVFRHQAILLPERTARIAVVRIETDQRFAGHKDDSALLRSAVANLQHISQQPGISALQIDFDAKRSERAFYRKLLTDLRQQMPRDLPLDITALVSWCSTDDWIGDLPINAATPMFFRMEPDRRRLLLNAAPEYQLREPLCSGSMGVSTTEAWPADQAGKQLFIFSDRGWAKDIAMLRPISSTSISQVHTQHP